MMTALNLATGKRSDWTLLVEKQTHSFEQITHAHTSMYALLTQMYLQDNCWSFIFHFLTIFRHQGLGELVPNITSFFYTSKCNNQMCLCD